MKISANFCFCLIVVNLIGLILVFYYINSVNNRLYDFEEVVYDVDLKHTYKTYRDDNIHKSIFGMFDIIDKKMKIKKEQISVLEESIDPKNKRWAKIKQVRKAVQDIIKKKGYKDTPNIIGLTSYASAVVDYSEAYDIPISLILAITSRESAFNPKAVSRANAKGIMQLISSTAAECAGDLGIRHYNIFRINTNVRMGTWYLRKVLDIFDGDVDLAIRAYNCGPTCVRKVVAGEWSDFPEETRKYIVAVKEWKKNYENLGL